jgi:DNA-binding protein
MLPDISIEKQIDHIDQNSFSINDNPVMHNALEVLSVLQKTRKITISGQGDLCPNTVAVANIIIENLLVGHSKAEKITVDGKISADGHMIPMIKISIVKTD